MTEWVGITAMASLNKIGYIFKEGFKSVFTHGFMSFASITIILACLIIMGSFSLLAININALIDKLEHENEMLAFVNEELTDEEVAAIEPNVLIIDNIDHVEFISREQAMASFKEGYNDDTLFEDIDPTVFRNRYVIYLKDISLMEETKGQLEVVDGIDDVSAQLEISQGFVTVRNVVSAVSLILVVILLIVSVFIMSNTIKLTTFGRREEIAIMKMVGATNSFIRTPFIIEGLVLGIFGALLAFIAQYGIYTLISERVMAGIAGGIVTVIPFDQLMTPLLLIFLGVGVVVGMFGGSIAIRNYLKV